MPGAVTVDELIEVIQEALVDASAAGGGMDDLEREALAHDVATRHLAVRARRAVEHGEPPIDLAVESELVAQAISGYFGSGKFQPLLDIPDVTDIMVNGADATWLQYADGRTERHPVRLFTDDDDLRAEVARLARRAGKSTLLRALIHQLPPATRMVVIEDTRELNIGDDPQRALTVLEWETREANVEGVGEITQTDLVRQALRFNPE